MRAAHLKPKRPAPGASLEQAQDESEERFRLLANDIPAALAIYDASGRILFANAEWRQTRGVSSQDLLGLTLEQVLRPEFLKTLQPCLQRCLKSRTRQQTEFTSRLPSGITITRMVIFVPSLDPKRCVHRVLEIAYDITARKATEEALRQSEQRYHSLFQAMNEGFMLCEAVFDSQGEPCDCFILEANPAFERLTGFRRSQALGKTFLQVFPEMDPSWIETLCHVALTQEPTHFERHSTQFNRFFEVFAYSPEAGKVACVFLDTTVRNTTEQALRDSQQRLSLAIDSTRLGTFDIHFEQHRAICSELARLHFGIGPDEPVTHPNFIRRIHPEDRSKVENAIERSCNLDKAGHFTIEYRRAPENRDNPAWICAWGRAFFDRHGKPARIIGVTLDITERKRMEQALTISEQKYRSFYESISEGFGAVDMDGRIIEANQAFCDMLGYSAEEIQKLTLREITPARWHPFEDKLIREELIGKGGSLVYQKELIRKDGSSFPAELRAYLVKDPSGLPLSMWAFARDLSQSKATARINSNSQQQYQLFWETLPHGVLFVDAERRIISANPAAIRILGHSLETLQGHTSITPELVLGQDGSPVAEPDQPHWVALRTGRPVQNTTLCFYNAVRDQYCWCKVSAVPLFCPGEQVPSQAYLLLEEIDRADG